MMMTTKAFRLGIVAICGLAATGCASVKISVPGTGDDAQQAQIYSERVALNDAADALSEYPWGETPSNGVVSVLFGTIAENEKSRAVRDYVEEIEARGDDPVTEVFADADASLAYARQVVEAGRQTIDAILPRSTDIATLERAISDARECRNMYVATLEYLDREDAEVSSDEIHLVRDAFSQTIDDMALTADLVANRVAMTQDRARVAESRALDATGAGGE